MRLFGICCYFIALFYGYTAVEAMRTGATAPLRGAGAMQRSDDPTSGYRKILISRWLLVAGFGVLGFVMHRTASKFDELDQTAPKK